ncbi:MAG: hypothetical protein ACP5ID_03060 [Conexivisphaera sp.]
MGKGAAGDPEYLLEGLLEGNLIEGAVYLLEGRYLRDREELLEGIACGAARRRRAVVLSFISPVVCPEGDSPSNIDASSIRDEGLKVVATRLMDGLSSGGLVVVDSAGLLLSMVGEEREYMNLLFTLRRIARIGRGTLLMVSDGGPEEAVADYLFEVGPIDVQGRRFRVVRVASPYSPSSRESFLLSSDRRLIKPAGAPEWGTLDLGELEPVVASMRPGSTLEIYVDQGVPEHLVEGFLDGLAATLKGAGLRASIYPGGAKDVGEDAGGLLILGRSEGSVSIRLGCQGCPQVRADYLAKISSVAGVPVVFFERPWSAAYYLDGLTLRRMDRGPGRSPSLLAGAARASGG